MLPDINVDQQIKVTNLESTLNKLSKRLTKVEKLVADQCLARQLDDNILHRAIGAEKYSSLDQFLNVLNDPSIKQHRDAKTLLSAAIQKYPWLDDIAVYRPLLSRQCGSTLDHIIELVKAEDPTVCPSKNCFVEWLIRQATPMNNSVQ